MALKIQSHQEPLSSWSLLFIVVKNVIMFIPPWKAWSWLIKCQMLPHFFLSSRNELLQCRELRQKSHNDDSESVVIIVELNHNIIHIANLSVKSPAVIAMHSCTSFFTHLNDHLFCLNAEKSLDNLKAPNKPRMLRIPLMVCLTELTL